jgi:anti-sigma factor RsiW
MNWICEQTEERLSDYLDNLLDAGERAEFERHAAGCAQCSQLIFRVSGTLRTLHSLESIEAPPELVSAILDQTLGPRAQKHGWRRWLAWTPVLLQPRFAMGLATAVASVVILFYAAGLNPAKLRKGDLNPVNIYRSVNRQTHLVYARGVKYVNDLRVVYEIQSRLRAPEPPARDEQQPSARPANQPQEKSQGSPHPGRTANRNASIYAYVVEPSFTRSTQ